MCIQCVYYTCTHVMTDEEWLVVKSGGMRLVASKTTGFSTYYIHILHYIACVRIWMKNPLIRKDDKPSHYQPHPLFSLKLIR